LKYNTILLFGTDRDRKKRQQKALEICDPTFKYLSTLNNPNRLKMAEMRQKGNFKSLAVSQSRIIAVLQ